VTLFHPAAGHPCYRCLFPEMPTPDAVPNCAEAGVLGALCGILGSWQANEALKWILSLGQTLAGRLKVIDSRSGQEQLLKLQRDPACPLCGDNPRIRDIRPEVYRIAACTSPADYADPVDIGVSEAAAMLKSDSPPLLVDVRQPHELALCSTGCSLDIPLPRLKAHLDDLPRDRTILVICHHGSRSRRAANLLRENGFPAARSVAGGIDAWSRLVDPSVPRY